jgi:hypothetical protein
MQKIANDIKCLGLLFFYASNLINKSKENVERKSKPTPSRPGSII